MKEEIYSNKIAVDFRTPFNNEEKIQTDRQ